MSGRRRERGTIMAVTPVVALVAALAAVGCHPAQAGPPRDGDVIFQTSLSSQSLAIQKATRSKYSHMGVVFVRDGRPFVLEAAGTVRFTPLGEWIARGQGGRYVIKRLRGADERLTPAALETMRRVAARFLGKPYDLYFEWSDDRICCSELVWKIYDEALGEQVGRLQRLRDFDLSDPVVRATMRERYGDAPPLDEVVIAPAAMFEAEDLTTVESR
jgi:hypothetical protein